MEISYKINSFHPEEVKIDLMDWSSELYQELEEKKLIDKLKSTHQLGAYKLLKKQVRTRYDYVMIQLYLLQVIRKSPKSKDFSLSLNTKLKEFEKFKIEVEKEGKKEKRQPTVADILYLLTIIYSIGHYKNTFTSSKAVCAYLREKSEHLEVYKKELNDTRFHSLLEDIIADGNIMRFHLFNSVLLLEQCDNKKASVKLAKEILYVYLSYKQPEEIDDFGNLIEMFKKVRSMSWMAYDLQASDLPMILDVTNKEGIVLLAQELLSKYNNKTLPQELIDSVNKLLGDYIYNDPVNTIKLQQVSNKIYGKLKSVVTYYNLIKEENSVANVTYGQREDFCKENILKVTFSKTEREAFKYCDKRLNAMNFVRYGYYNRHNGDRTIFASIATNSEKKDKVALRVLRTVVTALDKAEQVAKNDIRYLIVLKFFLFHLFSEHRIEIVRTISDTCVISTKGRIARWKEIDKLLKENKGSTDQRHEVEFIRDILKGDPKGDKTITATSSIVVYENKENKKIAEFDGFTLHINREGENIIYFEAKNGDCTGATQAKKCLTKKFDKLKIGYDDSKIETIGKDSYYKVSI